MRAIVAHVSLFLACAATGCSDPQRGTTTPTDDASTVGDDGGASDDGAAPGADLAHGGGGQDMALPPPSCKALVVKPDNATLLVDGVHQFSLKFHALCGKLDVSSNATWSVDDAKLGAWNGQLFTSAAGASGSSTVRAVLGGASGSTPIALKVTTVIIAAGAPVDAPKKFGGMDDPNLAPQWVYPADGVLIPPNLSELELQFLPAGNTLFEIAFSGGGVNLKIYTQCNAVGNGCAFEPDEPTWSLLSTVARSHTVTITLRGTSGGAVGSSAPRKVSFADEDIGGGLYYWAASTGGLHRYDFGLRGQKAEDFYTPGQAGAMCVGCHALARNGSRIAVGMNIPGPAAMRILDVATRKTTFDLAGGFGAGSNYQALTADGTKIVTTEAGGLTLRDAANGALLSKSPAVDNANMPDFAADGSAVVFARGAPTCNFGFCMTLSSMMAGIYSVPFANNQFGAVKTLVAPGAGNDYYPAFSPDGKYVVFNHAAADSYDAKDAHVMMVSSSGGNPVDQAGLNALPGNSWPKWAPFSHHFAGAGIFWITFSSRRPYGLRGGMNSQIWMAAVDAGKLAQNVDAAYPVFWLPFQDPSTGNHIAQWAEKVERPPCSQIDSAGCGPGEMCVNGNCEPGIQ